MATQYAPIAKDSSINTTENTPRNIADVLAEELSAIEQAIAGGSGSGGHTIVNASGTDMTQRAKMQFVDAEVTDDAANDVTKISTTPASYPSANVTYGSGSVEDALDGLTDYSYGTYVDLGDTSSASPYIAPSDGILWVDYPYNTTGYIYVNVNGFQLHTSKMHSGAAYTWTLPVRKGMSIYKDQTSVANPSILFVPYV